MARLRPHLHYTFKTLSHHFEQLWLLSKNSGKWRLLRKLRVVTDLQFPEYPNKRDCVLNHCNSNNAWNIGHAYWERRRAVSLRHLLPQNTLFNPLLSSLRNQPSEHLVAGSQYRFLHNSLGGGHVFSPSRVSFNQCQVSSSKTLHALFKRRLFWIASGHALFSSRACKDTLS